MKKNKSFQIFPTAAQKTFDWYLTLYARQLLLTFARGVARPTFLAIAEAWGVDRVRLSRIVEALGIKDELKELKRKK